MRIALVIDRLDMGGGLVNLKRLVDSMPEIEFGIFSNGGGRRDFFDGIPNVSVVDGNSPKNIMRFRPDLIHVNHLKPLVRMVFYKILRRCPPIIFTVRGLQIKKYKFQVGALAKLKYLSRFLLERELLRKVDQVVAVSSDDKNFLESKYSLNRVSIIPNGIPVKPLAYENNRAEGRRRLSVAEDGLLFVTVGRFDFPKGYDILVDAVGLAKDRIGSSKFLLVGDGPQFDYVKNKIDMLSLSGLFTAVGEVSNSIPLMSIADCFILPSRWEGLPTVLLEAGLCKLPVIASDNSGNREVISDGVSGILFRNGDPSALGDSIVRFSEHAHELRALGDALFEKVVSRFTIGQMVAGYRELYSQKIESASRLCL